MVSTQRLIYCPNPTCNNPVNSLEDVCCANCQTPLIYRYLWVTGSPLATMSPGQKVADRYEIIAPQVWLDTQPVLLPDIPEELPTTIVSYLRLYQYRLHLPQVYGLIDNTLLLENVPIDETGHLYPTITEVWEQAKATRQVYWLWQILQLWAPLQELGVAGSLLSPDNLRIQGWCVRLLELQQSESSSLQQLGESWQPLVTTAKTLIAQRLQEIIENMREHGAQLEAIKTQLNELLLACAAELPLTLKIAGATDTGPELTHNEDTYYPIITSDPEDPLLPQVSIVCDGIGGHEGGEVASQLAVQSLKLQIRALLTEVTEQTKLESPDLLQQQLEACIRIVNNVICNCNDQQKREGTQRMGTTVVMAVQVPQRIQTSSGWQSENAHELYIVNVGDSRAYWITRDYCRMLTVDDDVAGREVRLARSLYRKILQRPDATALTQALGTKDGEYLHPYIQRLIIEEDGLLLLCSDGLSDNHLLEHSWRDFAVPLLTGKLALEDAVRMWVDLANKKNGHDNISVVLTHCCVSPNYLVPVPRPLPLVEIETVEPGDESSFADSSQALLEIDYTEQPQETTNSTSVTHPSQRRLWLWIGSVSVLLVGAASLGLFAWGLLYPRSFQQFCRQLPARVGQVCQSWQRGEN